MSSPPIWPSLRETAAPTLTAKHPSGHPVERPGQEADKSSSPSATPVTPCPATEIVDQPTAQGEVILDLPANLPFGLDQIDLIAQQGFTGAAIAMIESALNQHPGQLPAGLLLRLVEHYRHLGRPVDLTRASWPLEQRCRVDLSLAGLSVLDEASLAQRLTSLWSCEDRCAELARWLLRPASQDDSEANLGLVAFSELLDLYLLARAIETDGHAAGLADSGPDRPQLQGETLERLDAAELSLAAPELQIRDELLG
jgi:hypothetical protein